MANQCRVVEELSQAMPPGSVWELALVECPVPMDLVWMVMTRCCRRSCILSFLCGFGVALGDERSHMGGVLICSPLYVLVAYVWENVVHILFPGVYL